MSGIRYNVLIEAVLKTLEDSEMSNKPKMIQQLFLEGKIIGAIMLDSEGYFYRPKRNSISVAAHSKKWDGDHYRTVQAVINVVFGE